MTAFSSTSATLDRSQSAYNDIQGLQSIKQLGREDKNAALSEVSKHFESMLVQMMLKNMRAATEVFSEGNFLSGNQVSFYQGMLDDQWSLELTKDKGLGFAEQLANQWGVDEAKTEDKSGAINNGSGISLASDSQKGIELIRNNNTLGIDLANLKIRLQAVNAVESKPNIAAQPTASTAPSNVENRVTGAKPIFDSPQQFIQAMQPYAKKAAERLGVEPKVLLAQAGLETGWGKYIPQDGKGNSSFNLFGIKADQRWTGPVAEVETVEYRGGAALRVKAEFRRYDSFAQSFSDYADFVSQQPRYQQALTKASDGHAYISELHKAGYATDPLYASKIQQIIGKIELSQEPLKTVLTSNTGPESRS